MDLVAVPEAPFVLLNVLSLAGLALLAWYICRRLPELPRWLVWGWLLFVPWTLCYGTHVLNPDYVLCAASELPLDAFPELRDYEPAFTCRDFLEARSLLEMGRVAAFLPDFLPPEAPVNRLVRLELPWLETRVFQYSLAWNPRLLRLNPHSRRRRDALAEALARQLNSR